VPDDTLPQIKAPEDRAEEGGQREAAFDEAQPVFPAIKRQVFDVLFDDDKSEVWIGMKLRQTVKGQMMDPRTRQPGPVQDIEVNTDALAILISLDSAKQEVIIALNKDAQALNEKRQRQAMLTAPSGPQGSSLMDRLSAGLGKTFAGKTQ
jgi:hypothetical protein